MKKEKVKITIVALIIVLLFSPLFFWGYRHFIQFHNVFDHLRSLIEVGQLPLETN